MKIRMSSPCHRRTTQRCRPVTTLRCRLTDVLPTLCCHNGDQMQARRIEIGSRLRECRTGANLSIAEVAEELKVTKQAVSAWENGTRVPDAIRLGDLALLYGVATDFILFGTHMIPEDLKQLFARVGRQA